MKPKPKENPAPASSKPKGTVLDQLKSRKGDKYAENKSRPGVAPPHGPKPAPAPRALSPTELVLPRPPQAPLPPNPIQPTIEEQAEGNVLEILFARAMRNRTDTKPADDPGMAMMQALSHQVQHGLPIKELEGIMVPHLGEMSSKIHLWRNAVAYHTMFERGALYALARWTLEKSLWDDLINQRLSPVEKLALLQLAIKEMDKVGDTLGEYQETLESGGKGTAADIESATEKSDRPLSKTEDPSAKDLEGTSPVGRELARRLMSKAEKAANKLVEDALKTPPTA